MRHLNFNLLGLFKKLSINHNRDRLQSNSGLGLTILPCFCCLYLDLDRDLDFDRDRLHLNIPKNTARLTIAEHFLELKKRESMMLPTKTRYLMQ